jgi:hypothetical protein
MKMISTTLNDEFVVLRATLESDIHSFKAAVILVQRKFEFQVLEQLRRDQETSILASGCPTHALGPESK